MKDKMTFPVGIAAVPSWNKPDVISFGTNIGVFRTGAPEQAAACWEFIRWFTGTERQAEWAVRTSYVPARRSSQQDPEYARMIEKIPGLKDQLAQLEYMSFEPRSEQWFNGRKILTQALEKIMRGRMSTKDALDEAASLVEKELRR
jgi:ABC-type glycerol-3-phosphate transport system substrate-binding protein